MSMTMEASVGIEPLPGTNTYVHPVTIPAKGCDGEDYGVKLGWRVLRRLREVASELNEKSPLLFPVRRFGDLTPKEVERVHEREAQIIASTFLSFKASPVVGRQLVTFAVCRWGHTTKRFAAILQELNKQEGPAEVKLWLQSIKQNATEVTPPTYMGTRDTA